MTLTRTQIIVIAAVAAAVVAYLLVDRFVVTEKKRVAAAIEQLRDSVALQRDQGELLLSREVRELSQSHDAQAVVVGTYAASASALYISLKLVTPAGNTVVAAHNYAVPMDENVRALLASGGLRY